MEQCSEEYTQKLDSQSNYKVVQPVVISVGFEEVTRVEQCGGDGIGKKERIFIRNGENAGGMRCQMCLC